VASDQVGGSLEGGGGGKQLNVKYDVKFNFF